MKKLTISLAGLFFLGTLAFFGCKKELSDPSLTSDGKPVQPPVSGNCTGYLITLDKSYDGTKTTFIWTITNPNPGNGSGTTIQNLSHWDFVAGVCLDANWQDVYAAAYRYGTSGDFIPVALEIKPDPSIPGCYTDDVVKFDQGTSGSQPTQYKLELVGNWGTGPLDVYFKSGANTGCCYKNFPDIGVGCPVSEDCSLSQGYWFANNEAHPDGVHPWYKDPSDPSLGLKTVKIGGLDYTNAEGLAIWNASNKGGIKVSKKAFTQLAAIRLSGVDETDPALIAAIATIDCFLATTGKLSPDNLPDQTAANKLTCGDANAAAGVISKWINDNHCAK